MRMRILTHDFKVFELIVKDGFRTTLNHEFRVLTRLASQLRLHLFHMVGIDVSVATGPNEVTYFQVALLSQHVSEQRVAGDIKGDT